MAIPPKEFLSSFVTLTLDPKIIKMADELEAIIDEKLKAGIYQFLTAVPSAYHFVVRIEIRSRYKEVGWKEIVFTEVEAGVIIRLTF